MAEELATNIYARELYIDWAMELRGFMERLARKWTTPWCVENVGRFPQRMGRELPVLQGKGKRGKVCERIKRGGEGMSGAQINLLEEIIVDNFAGGGGASTGIELATGRPVTIAINHDPDAILMHKTNHPFTEHYQASVWDVDPCEVAKGRPVGLAWFSPDCKHFSKAKGGKPVDKNIRGLAWIVLRWAGTVRPR